MPKLFQKIWTAIRNTTSKVHNDVLFHAGLAGDGNEGEYTPHAEKKRAVLFAYNTTSAKMKKRFAQEEKARKDAEKVLSRHAGLRESLVQGAWLAFRRKNDAAKAQDIMLEDTPARADLLVLMKKDLSLTGKHVETLLEKMDGANRQDFLNRLLIEAADKGSARLTRVFIEAKAEVSAGGQQPLLKAIESPVEGLEKVRLLHAVGARFDEALIQARAENKGPEKQGRREEILQTLGFFYTEIKGKSLTQRVLDNHPVRIESLMPPPLAKAFRPAAVAEEPAAPPASAPEEAAPAAAENAEILSASSLVEVPAPSLPPKPQ